MKNVWFSSDWHFGHRNLLNFVKGDGSPARTFIPDGEITERPFASVEEMDEVMIARHNERVGQYDKFYCLGDVSMNLTRFHSIMPRLNGKKRLILGNHDGFKFSEYGKYFEKIMESWQPLRNVVFTHRPILLGQDDHHKKLTVNVHGHTHNHVMADSKYMNICVEHTNYAPILGEDIIKEFKQRGIELG